jgi:hypothetical protein
VIRQCFAGAAAVQKSDGGGPAPNAAEIEELICRLQARFLNAKGEERQRLTLEYMRLKDELENAKAGQVIADVTVRCNVSD